MDRLHRSIERQRGRPAASRAKEAAGSVADAAQGASTSRRRARVRVLIASLGAIALGSAMAQVTAPLKARAPLPQLSSPVKKPVMAVHKARALKSLPSHPAVGGPSVAATNPGPMSPYARASAQRADSGLPPPGHPQVLPHVPAPPASKPLQ